MDKRDFMLRFEIIERDLDEGRIDEHTAKWRRAQLDEEYDLAIDAEEQGQRDDEDKNEDEGGQDKIQLDFEHAKEAFDLGEYRKAKTACRQMLKRLQGDSEEIKEIKSLLIDAMMALMERDDPPEPILKLLDDLFISHLRTKNRVAAAKTLIRTMEFLEEEDLSRAFEMAYKTIRLFGSSADEQISAVVKEAYLFVWGKPGDNSHEFLLDFGQFLARNFSADSVKTILEIGWYLYDECREQGDEKKANIAIQIIDLFLDARSDDLSQKMRVELYTCLAGNHFVANNDHKAIEIWTKLLIMDDGDSRYDYMLWCGEAFMCLGHAETANMYLNRVLSGLETTPDDSRAISAREYLEQIKAE